MQTAKVRRTWLFHVALPALIALGTIWLGSRVVAASSSELEIAERYLPGAAFIAGMFSNVTAVAKEAALARQSGEIEFLAAVPVSRLPLLFAMITLPVLYSTPAVFVVVLFGESALALHLEVSLLLPVAYLLCLLLMSCIGLAIGLSLTFRSAGAMSAAVPLMIMLLSPILVPAGALPGWMSSLGSHLPTTYAVDIFQDCLFGSVDTDTLRKTGVIGVTVVVLSPIILHLPGWRA